MQALTDEYDHRSLRKTPSMKREENAEGTENVALHAEDSEGNGKGGNNQKRSACFNCGKPGHWKDKYWAEGGGKEDQKPTWLKEKEK